MYLHYNRKVARNFIRIFSFASKDKVISTENTRYVQNIKAISLLKM